MKKYVTYGLGNKFDINKVVIKLKTSIGKPEGAFWGSPIDAKYGWKEWTQNNDYIPHKNRYDKFEDYYKPENTIIWTLEEGTKVLDIYTVDDLEEFKKKGYIFLATDVYERYEWNFSNILEDGYSAIELHDAYIGHYFSSVLEMFMNAWDCESIAVLKPEKIKQVDS